MNNPNWRDNMGKATVSVDGKVIGTVESINMELEANDDSMDVLNFAKEYLHTNIQEYQKMWFNAIVKRVPHKHKPKRDKQRKIRNKQKMSRESRRKNRTKRGA